MNLLLNYFIEANLCLLIFISFYFLFLRRETNFRLIRYFLIVSVLFSLTFPAIQLDGGASVNVVPAVGSIVPSYWLPEIVINPQSEDPSVALTNPAKLWTIIIYAYLVGLLAFSILFLFRLFNLLIILRKHKKYRWKSFLVAETKEKLPTFSFFKFICIGQADHLSDNEKKKILRHESIHAQQLHSFDILLITFIEIIFWFNPLVRTYKKIFIQTHEFEADARAVENHDLNDYCNLLARVALQSADISLANHFNKSLTIKRITMMQTVKKQIKHWKLAALVVAFPLNFFLFACQDQIDSEVKQITDNSAMALEYPSSVEEELLKLKEKNPNGNFKVIMMNEEGKKKIKELEATYGMPKSVNVFKSNETNKLSEDFIILELDNQTTQILENNAVTNEVFTVVEDQPEPPGGMAEFYKYIGENLKYPESARKAGVEGKVFVQFVVYEDGSVHDVKVIRGLDPECDVAALKVIAGSPAWKPGKQKATPVKVRMVMPINFKLGDTTPTNSLGQLLYPMPSGSC